MQNFSFKNIFTLENIKKSLPIIFLILLTVFLMVLFKHNKNSISSMIQEGKQDLLALYANNLKPMLYSSKINEEDIFNFALYQTIPVDKENKTVLSLVNVEGQDSYTIRKANYNSNTKNYETFKQYFELNNEQKLKADSILNSYKKEIYSCIFVNQGEKSAKEAYAFNPTKVSQLQKAVLADLINFAHSVNNKKAIERFPTFTAYNTENLKELIFAAKETGSNDYIVFTPDTVANSTIVWNEKELEKQISELEKVDNVKDFYESKSRYTYKFKEPPEAPSEPHAIKYKIDPNSYNVSIPQIEIPKFTDTLNIALAKAAKELKEIRIHIPKSVKSKHVTINGERVSEVVNPFEIAAQSLEVLKDLDIGGLIEMGMKMDAKKTGNAKKDSLLKKKMEEKLREVNKKLQRFKYNKDTTNN